MDGPGRRFPAAGWPRAWPGQQGPAGVGRLPCGTSPLAV